MRVDEDEGQVAYVVADNGDEFLAGVNDVGFKKGDIEKSEMLQLMRELMGRLDHLEESQSKIQGQLSGGARANKIVGAAPMSPGDDLFASALCRGPRMHIDALGGSLRQGKRERPVDPQRYLGKQHPGHNFPQSQLQRI